jgi:Xaa-Pro aminopeptidase
MPSPDHLQRRRSQLLDAIDRPLLLMAGGWKPRNYPQNPFPYRADSNTLFFFADPEPDSAALFDPADRSVALFLNERTAEDALWHGPVPSFADMRQRHGVTRVCPRADLATEVRKLGKGRPLDSLAVADPVATAQARAITGQDLAFDDPARVGRPELIAKIAELRNHKEREELEAIRATADVTRQAHIAAIGHTRPGGSEQELTGIVEGVFAKNGCVPAYNTILSVRGEVLHNHCHDNPLREGDIVLLDAGAEARTGYCTDVTRCWPVSGRFAREAGEVYDIVLRAETSSIAMVKPGVRYRDVHLNACRVIADGLKSMGILRGDIDGLVAAGAHAMFFPHGIGHLLGIDVHDMEAFGDQIGYGKGRARSKQFGLNFLRMDLDLEPGMTFTIEPGIYFVPAILHHPELRKQFESQIDYERAERFLKMNNGRGFGGVRIEDDVLCTERGADVLTAAIPKERAAIEELVGSAV